jgi:hypothetical protein
VLAAHAFLARRFGLSSPLDAAVIVDALAEATALAGADPRTSPLGFCSRSRGAHGGSVMRGAGCRS